MRALAVVAVAVSAFVACKTQSAPTAGSGSAPAPPVTASDGAVAVATPDAAVAAAPVVADEGSGSDGTDKLFDTESIGGLRPGSTEEQVLAILGKPKSRGKAVLEGATGSYVSSWTWPTADVEMTGDGTKGPWIARMVTVTALPFETKRHVHVGTPRAEVEKAYKRSPDDDGTKKDQYLVGSMYGGLLFTFKADKVSSIAMGPFAF